MQEMKLIPWYSRPRRLCEDVGDKIDANDKAAVEADLNALKEAINKAPIDQMTDAQVDEIKAGKEKLMNSAQAALQQGLRAGTGSWRSRSTGRCSGCS